MILNSAPQDQAVLSNVGQIGEFRIRNSAKAFSILSSGLYANKVRAIIRELSCNAVDSHTAAGKSDTPFDVHLPNSLEPWFSIRDYGTGLSAEQVTNIYTTYFESTKTASNEFIGALGLGSKSPFSYTDNFTVTAVQNGIKGVYTAFINESGVPSIAQMMTEQTTDPNGVEVKFSVNERHDFDKFRSEAREVYKFFKSKPVVSGNGDFGFKEVTYETENIIPGVHSTNDFHHSIAVMGNIAYPINIPDADKSLGDLRQMLNCGLVMEFSIGELDFQASREGLSYIDLTINSIKTKLEQANAALTVVLTKEADSIKNDWERAFFLAKKADNRLWSNAVTKYATDNKFDLVNTGRYGRLKEFELREDVLKSKYNILMRGFHKSSSYQACSNSKAANKYNYDKKDKVGNPEQYSAWTMTVSKDARFVINDTKTGASERAKYHYRNKKDQKSSVNVFVLEKFDKTRPILTKPFFKSINNPPESQILQASSLLEKPRADGSMGKNVTILTLVEKSYSRGSWGRDDKRLVWNDAGKADTFDSNTTHYYVPLTGFQSLGKVTDVKMLKQKLEKSGIWAGSIYGVRKADMEFIKTQKNWVNIDMMIAEKLALLDTKNVMGMVKQAIDFKHLFKYNASSKVINPASPYLALFNTFKDVNSVDQTKQQSLEFLARAYDVKTTASPAALINKYTQDVVEFNARYPMLKFVSGYDVKSDELAEYINMIDQTKGV
jgi:hypothetical protein